MSHPLVVNVRRAPRGTYVYVGRGSPFGNPFTHLTLEDTTAVYRVATRAEAVARYADWLAGEPDLLVRLPELRGRLLGCWCAPLACHADVLAELANNPPTSRVVAWR